MAPVVRTPRSYEWSVDAADAGTTPVALGTGYVFDDPPSVAVAPSGAAVVVWEQIVGPLGSLAAHVLAAVRPSADAPFGAPVMLGVGSPLGSPPSAGIDAAGRATVAWVSREKPNGASLLNVASTTTGGRFGMSQQLASATGDQVAVAISPAGRTLVVNYGSDSITAYERAAGAAAFAPVPVPASTSPDELAVALADDGSAVIAYRVDSSIFSLGSSVSAFALLRRPGGSGFGREQLLEGNPNGGFSSTGFAPTTGASSSPVPDDQGTQIAAALDASGGVLLTWVDPGTRDNAASAHVASGTIAGGIRHPVRFGSPCRAANAARPLTLSNGTLSAAWTDNALVTSRDFRETPLAGGLLHVVVPGQTTASTAGPPPSISARLISSPALHGGQPLRLRVRCRRGPCVVRAAATTYPLDSSRGDTLLVDGSIALPSGRAGVLTLDPAAGSTLARMHDATAQVSLLACTPTGIRAAHLALHLRLHRLPRLPIPRVLDLVARRHGPRIHVTWRTSIPARGATFGLTAQPFSLTHPVYAQIPGRGHSRFSITLHLPSSLHERTISIEVDTSDQPYAESATARIR